MKTMSLEEVLKTIRDKYGDIPIKIKLNNRAYQIVEVSVNEIEGFNYTLLEIKEE